MSTDSGPYAYHLGGTGVYSADMMTLGCWGAEAHVEQTGGTMNVELFRTSGPGTISFSGGSSSISDLRLSELRHADMSMNISGDAGVTTGSMVIGSYGTANVTQTGGNLQVGSIAIGQNAGSEGSLTVTGGTWSGSNDLTVGAGGKGDFIWDNGRTTLQRLHIGAAGGIQAGPGSVFEMTNGSSIVIHTVDASRVSLEEATFEMKPSSPGFGSHSMEVASRDMGPTEQGFEQNFALGKLDLQTTGEFCLKLYDQADNNPSDDGPDALYVDELLLGNSTIDTNGLPVYYRNGGEVKRLLSGDNNLDGEVNLLDFSMMCSNYETGPAGWNGGDCDGDGDVDDDDLSIFAESYTAHWDPQMVHAPEPGALLVMVTAGALLLKRRRR
ncbi:MAG: PEP-CTERM sorting domain-containing protein [Phycisphaerae bacterium]